MRKVDVAVIGASLAGATCVRELTRLGIDAVALERDAFPRDKVCGGFLSPGAVRVLEEIHMLEEVRAAGATEVHSARMRTEGVDLSFDLPGAGLGISRRVLDALVANHPSVERAHVRSVDGLILKLDDTEIRTRVIIDASGKLSRFTIREDVEEFGVQFYEHSPPSGVLDFWFFEDGYGGAVTVEDGRSNCCFLINKDALPRYVHKPGCRVTGPLAYSARPSPWIAIGDAAGMIDPFCGEGMRHALDTGRIAAWVVADGMRAGRSYEEMRRRYLMERETRWSHKRAIARWIRRVIRRPAALRQALRVRPQWFLAQMWR